MTDGMTERSKAELRTIESACIDGKACALKWQETHKHSRRDPFTERCRQCERLCMTHVDALAMFGKDSVEKADEPYTPPTAKPLTLEKLTDRVLMLSDVTWMIADKQLNSPNRHHPGALLAEITSELEKWRENTVELIDQRLSDQRAQGEKK